MAKKVKKETKKEWGKNSKNRENPSIKNNIFNKKALVIED